MRRAVILGSNGPSVFKPPLEYALNDIKNLREVLTSPICGFDVIVPEPGSKPNEVVQLIRTVAGDCSPEDTFICHFSGHGLISKGDLFLIWDESNPENLLATALPVADIQLALRHCAANNKLLILDCCRAGAALKTAGIRDSSDASITNTIAEPDNFVMLLASDKVSTARELASLEGGFLTSSICAALGDELHAADKDGDNRISIPDLKQWLEQKALAFNNQQVQRKDKLQIPYFFGQQKGEFYFTLKKPLWTPYEIPWPDGSTMVVLPIRPRRDKALCISKHPITNEQYKKFTVKTSYAEPRGKNLKRAAVSEQNVWIGPFQPWDDEHFNLPSMPVVCVSFDDAVSYCQWVSKLGLDFSETKLPSPQIWDFAAFGDAFPSHRPGSWKMHVETVHDKDEHPISVDGFQHRINGRGVVDMFGNVWEWCHPSVYAEDYFLERNRWVSHSVISIPIPQEDFKTAEYLFEREIELRGGGFFDDLSSLRSIVVKVAELSDRKSTKHSDLGFRIAGLIRLDKLPQIIEEKLFLCEPNDELFGLFLKSRPEALLG